MICRFGRSGRIFPSCVGIKMCGFGRSCAPIPEWGGGVVIRVRGGKFHQRQIDLIGVAAAYPLFPDEPRCDQFPKSGNRLFVGDLHFGGKRLTGEDDEHLAVVIHPAVQAGELEAVE